MWRVGAREGGGERGKGRLDPTPAIPRSIFLIAITKSALAWLGLVAGTVEMMRTSLFGGGTAVLMAKAFAHLFALSHINIEIRKQQQTARQQAKDRLPSLAL